MSTSVWIEEVCEGLIKELQKSLRIRDNAGNYVPLQEDAFSVRTPEQEFKSEVYPCCSLFSRGYKFSTIRYNPSPVTVGINEAEKFITLEDSAIPYDLTFQIEFWSRYKSDMDAMISSWLVKHFRQFNLTVRDQSGGTRSCNCMTKGSIIPSNLVSNGDVLYRSIINLTIWVELDENTRYNKSMVVESDISVKSSN